MQGIVSIMPENVLVTARNELRIQGSSKSRVPGGRICGDNFHMLRPWGTSWPADHTGYLTGSVGKNDTGK